MRATRSLAVLLAFALAGESAAKPTEAATVATSANYHYFEGSVSGSTWFRISCGSNNLSAGLSQALPGAKQPVVLDISQAREDSLPSYKRMSPYTLRIARGSTVISHEQPYAPEAPGAPNPKPGTHQITIHHRGKAATNLTTFNTLVATLAQEARQILPTFCNGLPAPDGRNPNPDEVRTKFAAISRDIVTAFDQAWKAAQPAKPARARASPRRFRIRAHPQR